MFARMKFNRCCIEARLKHRLCRLTGHNSEASIMDGLEGGLGGPFMRVWPIRRRFNRLGYLGLEVLGHSVFSGVSRSVFTPLADRQAFR